VNGCELRVVNWVADCVWFAVLRPNNLWQPVPSDHGAFDGSARSWIPQLWANEHRVAVALAALTLIIFGILALFKES